MLCIHRKVQKFQIPELKPKFKALLACNWTRCSALRVNWRLNMSETQSSRSEAEAIHLKNEKVRNRMRIAQHSVRLLCVQSCILWASRFLGFGVSSLVVLCTGLWVSPRTATIYPSILHSNPSMDLIWDSNLDQVWGLVSQTRRSVFLSGNCQNLGGIDVTFMTLHC